MQDIKTDGKVIMLPPKKSVNFSSLKQEKEFDPDESIGVSADLRELSATSLPGKSILKASSKAAPLRVHFSKLSLDKECELDPDDTPLTKQEWKFDPDDSLPLIRKINLNLEPIRSNIKVCPKTPKDYTTEMEDLVPMRRDRTHNLKYYLPCSRLLLKWHSLIHLEQDGTIPTLKDTVLQIEKEEKEEKEELKGKEEEELRKESNPASSLGVSSSSSDSTNLEGASGYSDITDLEGASGYSDITDLEGACQATSVSITGFQYNDVVGTKISEYCKKISWLLTQEKNEFILNTGEGNTTDLIYDQPCSAEISELLDEVSSRTKCFWGQYNLPNYMIAELTAAARYIIRNWTERSYDKFINVASKEINKRNKGKKWKGNDLKELQSKEGIDEFLIRKLGLDIDDLSSEALKVVCCDNDDLRKTIQKITAMIIVVSGSEKFTDDKVKIKSVAEDLTNSLLETLLLGMKLSVSFDYTFESSPHSPVCKLKFKSASMNLVYES